MKKLLLCFVLAAATIGSMPRIGWTQSPALTTVVDTIYNADASLRSCAPLQISWPSFFDAASKPIIGGSKTLTVTNGALSTSLVPTAGGTPSGTSYRVRCYQSTGSYFEETWVVPASADPLTLSQVRVIGVTEVSGIAGTLPVANGGWGLTSLNPHKLYAGNGTSPPNAIETGAAGQVLVSSGADKDPEFQDVPQASAKGLPVRSGLPLPPCNRVRWQRCQLKTF